VASRFGDKRLLGFQDSEVVVRITKRQRNLSDWPFLLLRSDLARQTVIDLIRDRHGIAA
jgi:hypothetical protein